jgi:hypothetical protein
MGRDITALADPRRWTVTLLALPRRQRYARGKGFCGGFVVGDAEGMGTRSMPYWWPHGQPEPLHAPGRKRLAVKEAHAREIAGWWLKSDGSNGGAIGWRLAADGALSVLELHPSHYAWTSALSTGGGAFAGYGQTKPAKGSKAVDRALFWRPDGSLLELDASPGQQAMASGTDGQWIAGTFETAETTQAALWRDDGSPLVTLGDFKSLSAAKAVRDGEQVGERLTGRGSRAALWRGDAASFVDLTPEGHESASATDCEKGLQVGYTNAIGYTAGSFGNLIVHAALWAGSAASWVDLQAMVPAPWNASSAASLEVAGDTLRIVGTVQQISTEGEATSNPRQWLAGAAPVVWEARLS